MAFGPPICAACGSSDGIEAHHLYSRRAGCPDDLTVWLCHACHGRAHGMRRRVDIASLTGGGLAAAKARGAKLGGYRGGPVPDAAVAAVACRAKADAFAARVQPIARELQAEGKSLAAVAAELTRRGVRTARGGVWTAQAVKNLLTRWA